jgi:peroxiredoxin (alkyl hydroperoxide reductase subunit C)
MTSAKLLVAVVWALYIIETNGYFQEESCHSFAGGSVYPQGSPKNVDHKLTWTKAVSK